VERISGNAQLSKGDRYALDYFVVLLILWLLGFSLHIAGGLIHLLLVVALVVLVINLFSRPRRGSLGWALELSKNQTGAVVGSGLLVGVSFAGVSLANERRRCSR